MAVKRIINETIVAPEERGMIEVPTDESNELPLFDFSAFNDAELAEEVMNG